jgi:hypothetical protein
MKLARFQQPISLHSSSFRATGYVLTAARALSFVSFAKRSLLSGVRIVARASFRITCIQTAEQLVSCDRCMCYYHLECAAPPLTAVPDAPWVCQFCVRLSLSLSPLRICISHAWQKEKNKEEVERILYSRPVGTETPEMEYCICLSLRPNLCSFSSLRKFCATLSI